MQRTDIVDKISKAIHTLEPSSTAILYGSQARGDARIDSNIDVLILLDGDKRDFKREERISGKLYEIELDSGVIISPMILLRRQWEERPIKTPFYINIINEGVKI